MDQPKKTIRPRIVIYTDDISIKIVGKHEPKNIASTLINFSNGSMSEAISNALIKNGVDAKWIDEYLAAAETIKKELSESEANKRPIISALEAFQ